MGPAPAKMAMRPGVGSPGRGVSSNFLPHVNRAPELVSAFGVERQARGRNQQVAIRRSRDTRKPRNAFPARRPSKSEYTLPCPHAVAVPSYQDSRWACDANRASTLDNEVPGRSGVAMELLRPGHRRAFYCTPFHGAASGTSASSSARQGELGSKQLANASDEMHEDQLPDQDRTHLGPLGEDHAGLVEQRAARCCCTLRCPEVAKVRRYHPD